VYEEDVMRIGATQLFFAEKSVADSLAYAKETGYESLELVVREQADLKPDTDEAMLKAMRQEAERLGMTIPSLVPQAANTLASADPAAREAAVEGIRKAIRLAQGLGADTILVHPGQLTPQVRYDVMYDNVQTAMRQLVSDAERARVAVGVENVWNKFLLSPLEAKRFCDEIGSEHIGVYFDVGNFVPWAFPEQWIEMLGRHIKKVHFKDFKRRGHEFVPLLEGDVDWPAVMAALRGVGYDTEVIQEVAGDEAGMRATAEAMRKILAM
jgi:L-ribulose-5-phosphate 3-epimerase